MRFLICVFLIIFCIQIKAVKFIDEYRAVQAFNRQEYDKSYKLFEKVVVNEPDNIQNLYNLANAAYKRGEFNNAENYYKRVAEIKDLSPLQKEEVFFNLASSLAQLNLLEEALKYFEKVVEVNKENVRAKNNIEKIKKLLEEKMKKEQEQKKNQDKNQEQDKEKNKPDQEDQDSGQNKEQGKEQDKKNKEEAQQKSEKKENNVSGFNLDKKAEDLLAKLDARDKTLNKALVKNKVKQDFQNQNGQNGQNNW